jgi:DNA-damage-inducible protein J
VGINTSQAVNMFLRQVVLQQGIPFEVTARAPNATTVAAMREADRMAASGAAGRDVESVIASLDGGE